MHRALASLQTNLARAAVRGASLADVLTTACTGLRAGGVPVARASLSTTTVHPLVNAHGVVWRPADGAVGSNFQHTGLGRDAWRTSPLRHMLDHRLDTMRQRLDGDLPDAFPVFAEFRADGMTDWFACLQPFAWSARHLALGDLGMILSLATDAPGGFSDADLRLIEDLSLPVAAAARARMVQDLAHGVLSAYLGAGPAEQVLSGAITRGSVAEIPAVLMMADLRGFTARGDAGSIADLVSLINATFESAARPIEAGGGQILKFMGDGFLAVFLTEGRDEADAVDAALVAAAQIQHTLPAGVELDVAVHIGDVHYGNIGAADRLDFTVIGSAVNEVARLEGLCSVLGRAVLVSGAAASRIGGRGLVSLGLHALRGLGGTREVFTLAHPP